MTIHVFLREIDSKISMSYANQKFDQMRIFIADICELMGNNDSAMNDRKPPISVSMHLICLHSLWNFIFNESLMPSNIAKATKETNVVVCNIENRKLTDKRYLLQGRLWVPMCIKALRHWEKNSKV